MYNLTDMPYVSNVGQFAQSAPASASASINMDELVQICVTDEYSATVVMIKRRQLGPGMKPNSTITRYEFEQMNKVSYPSVDMDEDVPLYLADGFGEKSIVAVKRRYLGPGMRAYSTITRYEFDQMNKGPQITVHQTVTITPSERPAPKFSPIVGTAPKKAWEL